ncbi:MAG: gamma-glutamylcyclotransferase family protein, partial [Candidatus Rokuibacteriota bacterium]
PSMGEARTVGGKRVSDGPAHPAPPPLLFAYGTLMQGLSRHRFLARGASFVGPARVQGRLLSLGSYPGLVEGTGSVRGELYRLERAEVLADIDREEGYNFERRTTLVRRADGRRARAWTYWYCGPRTRALAMPEGDWRSRWR